MDTLTLGQGQVVKNRTTQVDRHYIEFIVSGKSLGQLFGLPDFDLIGTLGWTDNKECENKQIDEFLGLAKPELTTGADLLLCMSRVWRHWLRCCGAITATIEVTDKYVV